LFDGGAGATVAGSDIFGTDSSVGATIALLEARLPAVRERRRLLEEELAAAIVQEDAVVSVLDGLKALSGSQLPVPGPGNGPSPAQDGAEQKTEVDGTAPPAAVAVGEAPATAAAGAVPSPVPGPAEPARKAVGRKTAPSRRAAKTAAPKAPAKKAAVAGTKAAAPTGRGTVAVGAAVRTAADAVQSATRRRRRLTDAESVLAVLGQAAGPLRARQVADLLGLDDASATVDAIRTMLERLTKAGRARRSGRGLYTAAA
jgi:hypothetical protein